MNYKTWIAGNVLHGKEASIKLGLLERGVPSGVSDMHAIKWWAEDVCREFKCTATIHEASDCITFYPARSNT